MSKMVSFLLKLYNFFIPQKEVNLSPEMKEYNEQDFMFKNMKGNKDKLKLAEAMIRRNSGV